jgi:hypothetical protein
MFKPANGKTLGKCSIVHPSQLNKPQLNGSKIKFPEVWGPQIHPRFVNWLIVFGSPMFWKPEIWWHAGIVAGTPSFGRETQKIVQDLRPIGNKIIKLPKSQIVFHQPESLEGLGEIWWHTGLNSPHFYGQQASKSYLIHSPIYAPSSSFSIPGNARCPTWIDNALHELLDFFISDWITAWTLK